MSEEKKDTIEVPKEEWQSAMEIIKNLQGQVKNLTEDGQKPRIMQENKGSTVKMRFIDDKPVLGFANKGTEKNPRYVYPEQDPNDKRNMLQFVDVLVQGEKKPIKINYNEFKNNVPQIECKVLETKVVEDNEEQGVTDKVEYKDGYGSRDAGYKVPLKVEYTFRTYVIELPNGEKLTVPEENVNL